MAKGSLPVHLRQWHKHSVLAGTELPLVQPRMHYWLSMHRQRNDEQASKLERMCSAYNATNKQLSENPLA